jgi:tetraacyldisaccharide 4'-kinase
MKRKFPAVVVAVDTNRIAAIKRISQDHPEVKLIVLDDAFQYRRLKPAYSILLSDYHRPYTKGRLLPFGRLRDLPAQASRADMIIVTKAPPEISSAERENQHKLLRPHSSQSFLFSCYSYGAPRPLFPGSVSINSISHIPSAVIVITGIAHPTPFLLETGKQAAILEHLKFPDHHAFTKKDVLRINALNAKHPGVPMYTTEKDAMRLIEVSTLSDAAKAALYYVPVQVDFCAEKERCQFADKFASFLFR